MPIEVKCQGCGAKLRAPDTAAGKTKKCPKCGSALPIPAPEPQPQAEAEDISLYELALDAEPKPEPAAPDPVIIKPAAQPAAEPSPASPAPNTGLGHYADALTARVNEREDGAGRGPLMSIMGIDITIGRLIGLGVVILLIAFTGVWWTTLGPGRTHAILDTRTVFVTPVLESGQIIEPYSLATMEGDMVAGIKGASDGLGPAVNAIGMLPGGEIMTVGRSDQLLVTRDDKDGDHILIELELSQALLNRLGQASSNYEVIFRADKFALQPADGSMPPLKPYMLYGSLDDGRADLDIGVTKSTNYHAILPAGAPPTSEQLDKYGKRVQGGKMYWAGEAGTRGDLDFTVFLDTTGMGGGGGFSADGDVKLTDPGGSVVDMQYNGGSLTVSWNAGSQGHWARESFNKKEGDTSFTKFKVGLVFERPYTDQPLVLYFAGKKLAKLGKRYNAKEPTSASSGTTVFGYFDMLAEARNRARGIVSDSNMVQIGYAIQLYVDQNKGRMPERLEDLKSAMPGLDSVLENKRTGDNPGYVYVKPADTIQEVQDPSNTVILYESKGGSIDPDGSKLYADGHIEQGG